MDIRKVKKLIELLEESNISEIEIQEGEESVRISRHPNGFGAMQQPMVMQPMQPMPAPSTLTFPFKKKSRSQISLAEHEIPASRFFRI